jgi:(p)ppGpp synthase/HD superfamily hydrolase
MNTPLIELARSIAYKAHEGQLRRDGVTPYITHPEAVATKLYDQGPEVVATAWLHDVIEDTKETAESLLAKGIPEGVVDAVTALTRASFTTYGEYLNRVRANEIAKMVKVVDMIHNLSSNPTKLQIIRYAKALIFLSQ